MDPNLFHIDWERTIEALVGIIVLAFLVERALAIVFESRWYLRLFEDLKDKESPGTVAPSDSDPPALREVGRRYPVKEGAAFLLAVAICFVWDFDAVSVLLLREHTHEVGKLITAGVVAGGSKASIALFHDLMRVRSGAAKEKAALKRNKKDGEK